MSLGSFMNKTLDPSEKTQLQERIDQAVLCGTVVGQRVLWFLNVYYRFQLESNQLVPEITDDLIKGVMDKMVSIKTSGSLPALMDKFFDERFAHLIAGTNTEISGRRVFNELGKVIASGMKNPLTYMARNIRAICENHIVTNIPRRVKKLMSVLIMIELNARHISRRSYPVRRIADHLYDSFAREGPDVSFSLPKWMTGPTWKSKLSPENLETAHTCAQLAFDLTKTNYLRGLSLKDADIAADFTSYFPLVFAILRLFTGQREEWKKTIEHEPLLEQKRLARLDYRGGRIVKEFPLLPEFGDGWQPIVVDNFTLVEWFGKIVPGQDPQQVYKDMWSKYFRPLSVVAQDPRTRSSDRNFHYMIKTDGVWVGVMVETTRSRKMKAMKPSREDEEIPGVSTRTAMRLLSTTPQDLLGKVVAVVDPGTNPIITVGYYRIGAELDENGDFEATPYMLSEKQQRDQGCVQRKWSQRNSKRTSGKGTSPRKTWNSSGKVSIIDPASAKPTRRYHGHFLRVSSAYWSEIAGVTKRRLKLTRWEMKAGLTACFNEAQDVQRTFHVEGYTLYLKHRLESVNLRLSFRGQRRVRRLRLDAHIGKKRAEGEIARRLLSPAGQREENLVVIWGDGNFKHNMNGAPSSPCGRLRTLLSRGFGGRSAHGRRHGIIPGCEHNSSQRCPRCHGVVKHKLNGQEVHSLSVCGTCKKHSGAPLIVER